MNNDDVRRFFQNTPAHIEGNHHLREPQVAGYLAARAKDRQEKLRIELPREYGAGDTITVEVRHAARPHAGLYFVGSDRVTALFGNEASDLLRALGSGSRFESIAPPCGPELRCISKHGSCVSISAAGFPASSSSRRAPCPPSTPRRTPRSGA